MCFLYDPTFAINQAISSKSRRLTRSGIPLFLLNRFIDLPNPTLSAEGCEQSEAASVPLCHVANVHEVPPEALLCYSHDI